MPAQMLLTLSCDDRTGIVAAISSQLMVMGGNIVESAQFRDPASNRFFMRVAFDLEEPMEIGAVEAKFAAVFERYGMDAQIVDRARRPKIVIMVSKFDHAMLHLLYQIRVGWLHAEVAAIVSNHPDAARWAEIEGVPFHHLPVTKETKAEQEAQVLSVIGETGAELVVLARYMQVLSDDLSNRLAGRCINIHHSFLPSFKGAKPYHQAHARGVKLIGATAHYVTPDLDEGPIIEQETVSVSHSMEPDDLVAAGRDVESRVLARAVRNHLERRVFLCGRRTVVFAR
ncbi:MAG: formyltetrahydrofolate deformylase [Rubricella sp.]